MGACVEPLHMFKCKSNAMSAQLICSTDSEKCHRTRQERGHCQNMVAPIAHSDLSDPFWWDWFSKTSFLAVTVCMPLSMIIVKHVHCDHYHDIAFWWLSLTFFKVKLIITGFKCYLLCEKILEQPDAGGRLMPCCYSVTRDA